MKTLNILNKCAVQLPSRRDWVQFFQGQTQYFLEGMDRRLDETSWVYHNTWVEDLY